MAPRASSKLERADPSPNSFMGLFVGRVDRPRPSSVSDEETQPFLRETSSEFDEEKERPRTSESLKPQAGPFTLGRIIMALLTAGVLTTLWVGAVAGQKSPADEVCTSAACIHASSDILYNLHPDHANIDPCTNFDEFVCGGWEERHDLRSDQADIFAGTIMAEQAQSMLLHIFDAEQSEDATARCPGTSVKDKNFCKAKAAYDACIDEATIEEKGVKPLQDVLDKLVEAFPTEGSGENSLTDAILYLSDIGVEALVSAYISADDRDPDNVAIFANPPTEIGLPSKEYYNDTEILAKYTKVVTEVLGGFGLKDGIDEIIGFETKLAESSPDTAAQQDVTQYYNPLTLAEATSLLPQVSIERIISSRAPEGFETDRVIVGSPSYMEDLSGIIKETSPETIQAFLKWKVIQGYGSAVEAPAVLPLRRFNNEMQGKDPDSVEERWRTCVDSVDTSLGWISSALFVETAFSEDSKKFGDQIVSDIKERFVETLETTEWMSKEVQDLAITKVGNIVQKIGYPTKSPDVQDPEALQKYYENLQVANNTYFANALAVAKFNSERGWAKLGKPTDRDEWGMTVPTVNAYYNPPGNEIVFPAGIMQAPVFYDSESPKFLSYGAFGAIAGHELSHAFDSTGRRYDQIGNYTDWWDNSTIAAFEERTACFVDQYADFTVPGPNDEPLHVNGKLTLGENIADAGGLKAAYQAWKKHDDSTPDKMLPGLDSFNKEKLFFVSYSSFWCSKTRKEAAIERIYSDPHAPKPARILGTVANSREFREAYECPVKEPTCELW